MSDGSNAQSSLKLFLAWTSHGSQVIYWLALGITAWWHSVPPDALALFIFFADFAPGFVSLWTVARLLKHGRVPVSRHPHLVQGLYVLQAVGAVLVLGMILGRSGFLSPLPSPERAVAPLIVGGCLGLFTMVAESVNSLKPPAGPPPPPASDPDEIETDGDWDERKPS